MHALSGSYYAMILAALNFESVFDDLDANFAEFSPEEVLTLQRLRCQDAEALGDQLMDLVPVGGVVEHHAPVSRLQPRTKNGCPT